MEFLKNMDIFILCRHILSYFICAGPDHDECSACYLDPVLNCTDEVLFVVDEIRRRILDGEIY